MPDITGSFLKLADSTAKLSSFTFASSNILPRAVLSPEDYFETHLIRDAAPHELALFEPNPATSDLAASDEQLLALQQQADQNERWVATKRKAPQRVAQKERASPLKERRRQTTQPGAVDEADRCLRAAQKLLDIYTMPRASEHVLALHSQWVGLVDSISDLEESLRRPPSRPAAQPQHDDSYYRQLELEDAIKREQLEIFALEQIKAEKEAEAAVKRPARPAPGPAARKVPAVVANARTAAASSRPAKPVSRASLPPPVDASPEEAGLASKKAPRQSSEKPKPTRRVPSVVAAAQGARTRPSTGAAPTPPSASPAAPRRARTPAPPSPAADTVDDEPTPKPTRTAPAAAKKAPPPAAASPPPPPKPKQPSLPAGVTPSELELVLKTVWSVLGDGASLRAWGRKWAQEKGEEGKAVEEELGKEDGQLAVKETLEILRYALSASSSSLAAAGPPGSPSAGSVTSFSTLTSTTADASSGIPTTWSPAQIVEAQLLLLTLSTLSSSPVPPSSPFLGSTNLPALNIILRDPLPTGASQDKTPCLSMAALKAHLGAFAKAKGWTEEMGTTAVYALVSKGLMRIDRRGREGAAVGIRT
ncbi:hypothetical protein JCM8097_008021 [Rhodosporidiobolus ruineniae]